MDNIFDGVSVKELVKKDFKIDKKKVYLKQGLTEGLNGILVIYAPWCDHCQLTKEMWQNIARLFKYKFKIYALNTYNFRDNNQDMTLPLDVTIYPAYKFVRKNGEVLNYDAESSEPEVMKFIIKNM